MITEYGFFDSEQIGTDEYGYPVFDRAKDSAFMARFFGSIFTNGIVFVTGSEFKVSVHSGNTLQVEPGVAWINGRLLHVYPVNEADVHTIALADAAPLSSRVVIVALRLNYVTRDISIYAIEGNETYISEPVAPSITRNNDVYDLAIASVKISTASVTPNAAVVTDLRDNPSYCGWSSLVGNRGLYTSSTYNVDGTFYYGDTPVPTGTRMLNYSGYLRATRVIGAVYNDIAEVFETDQAYPAGTVLCMGDDGVCRACVEANDARVVGVVSDSYGYLLGADKDGAPVALCGRVEVQTAGEVRVGDVLVASYERGRAMTNNAATIRTAIGKVVAVDGDRVTVLVC